MADGLRFAPWLLIAVAVDPAAAQPQLPSMKLQSVDAGKPDGSGWSRQEPIVARRLFEEDRVTLPDWNLPFRPGAEERNRRGLSFSVRPSRGLKAIARFRF